MGFRGAVVVMALAVVGAGCASRAGTGSTAGAGTGAAAAGVATGPTARGALAEAAIGGAAGQAIGRRMDEQAARLRRELDGAEVVRVGEGISVTFESGILFGFDSSTLQARGRASLSRLAAALEDEPRTEVLVVGHTDGLGRDTYNQGLSERRAVAAADWLARQGVRRRRVWTSGRGESEPLAPNDTAAGRRKNRRVEVAIFAGLEWREMARRDVAPSR